MLSEVLLEVLPPGYDARVEQRMLLLLPDAKEQRRPDVAVTQRGDLAAAPGAAVTTAAPLSPAPALVEMLPLEVREERQTWVDIYDVEHEALVTSIEVLSPSNKDACGREPFRGKRNNLLLAGVHLVDVDLLLGGERLPFRDPLPAGHFYAFVTRAERRPPADEVYAWGVRDPLPSITVPLRAPNRDVTVDLGEAYRLAFERGRYPRRLRYRAPAGPLAEADQAWARGVAASAAPSAAAPGGTGPPPTEPR